jgi:hypothetical protein
LGQPFLEREILDVDFDDAFAESANPILRIGLDRNVADIEAKSGDELIHVTREFSGLRRNLFHTSSIPMMTLVSSAESVADLPLAALPGLGIRGLGLTTAGTSSTVSAPQSLALRRLVRMPSMLFSTTAGSADESGLRQCSEFITECMGSCVLRDAASTSSAAAASGMVGHSIASNPASRAIWKRSSTGIFPGSMLNSTALRIGNRAGAATAAATNGAAARI